MRTSAVVDAFTGGFSNQDSFLTVNVLKKRKCTFLLCVDIVVLGILRCYVTSSTLFFILWFEHTPYHVERELHLKRSLKLNH